MDSHNDVDDMSLVALHPNEHSEQVSDLSNDNSLLVIPNAKPKTVEEQISSQTTTGKKAGSM